MIITDIVPQKRNERLNIYIDGKFAFGLSEELRFKYELYIDKEVTPTFINDILKAEEEQKAINQALNILSYSSKTKKLLYDKLKLKGYEEEYIQGAIEYCEERNYISDETYAKNFISDKTRINKHGSNKIRYDLLLKGVSKETIEDVMDISFDEEYERALELAHKKMRSYKDEDKNVIYSKLGGFLSRRGYPFDIVSKVLTEILNEIK